MSSLSPRATPRSIRWLIALVLLLSLVPSPGSTIAQSPDCRPEVEPNNTETEVEKVESEFCIAGDLPEVPDQDLFLWTVTDTDAKFLWRMTVTGPASVVTSAKIFSLSSEPGVEPIVAGPQIGEVGTTPESIGPVSGSFLMAAGDYLIGISRTDSADGSPPLTTGYELSLAHERRLPKRLDDEPNDETESASAVTGAFESAGNLMDTRDYYAWTLSEEDGALGWELHVQVALGQTVNLTITTEQFGPQLVSIPSNQQGQLDLYDLALESGTYFLELSPAAAGPAPYLLSSSHAERPESDLEPNDQAASATPIDLANPVLKGRLAANNDADMFRLTVDEELAGSLFDLRLNARTAESRRLCLNSLETGIDLQCKEGQGGAALANILLPRGEYLIRVTGEADPADHYILRLDVTTAPANDFETEPNDSEEFAAVLDPAVPIRGRFDGDEWDVYRFTTAGDPQLWDITIAGMGIGDLDYTRRDGTELSTAEISSDRTSGRLSDLYLTPGDHWIRVRGVEGDYTVTLTPLGPPPPDGEHEANNQLLMAEPMRVGETKSGRLVEMTDTDVFRFSLAATEHVVLELTPPDDGTISFYVDWGQSRIAAGTSTGPGESSTVDLTLNAGDYVVILNPSQVSDGRYKLELIRADPFQISDDQEPNDTPGTAQPLAAGSSREGNLDANDSRDVFSIAPADDRDLTFVLESEGAYLILTDGEYFYDIAQSSSDPAIWTIDERVPDEVPLFLEVGGTGPYTVRYGPPEEGDGPGPNLPGFLDPGDEAAAPLEAELAFEASEIAAYWYEGQIVDGTLTLANQTDESVEFLLSSATTDFHFTVEIDDAPARIDADQTLEVPITVIVEPDAWADIPVQITIAAFIGDLPVSAGAQITPTADAPPLNTFQAWPLPVDLRGGLDLASPAHGAVVAGTVDPEGEALLHDGVAPIGSGLSVSSPVLPLTLTVDLAGDAPAPIAGITINPQSRDGFPQHQVREFELLLSTDGVTFTSVITRELSPIAREQWFVIGLPAEATHAQLVIHSTYDDNPTQPRYLQLGEWSVIATPGYVPETVTEIDIGDARNGGHVVRWSPQPSDPNFGVAVLSPDDADSVRNYLYPLDSPEVEWVVGFADNRAARISELRWIDHPDSVAEDRLSTVDVQIATQTPSGPWESVGTWDLSRNGDGSVRPFIFDDVPWARFVRFSGQASGYAIEFPAQLSIIEAAIDDEYLSVTGAWGSTSSAAYFEVLNPPPSGTLPDEVDSPDDPAQATELALAETINGRAQIGKDVDWYRVTAPEDDNTLTFTLTGAPTVDVVVRIYDSDSNEVPAVREVGGDASTVEYIASVTPGAEYLVEVQQPPHSIVFAFDTSASMGAYQPLVQQSLRSFASGVQRGQEFVQVLPFEEDPLLETWTDDSYVVYSGINGYYDKSLSSSAETAILDSTELLADQEGSTAILIITDAETSSYGEGLKMWQALDVTQPRIFAVHVGGSGTPVINEHLMQDWSSLGGYYQYTTSQAEMDRAFDRAATWLRRPAPYGLSVTSTFEKVATPTPEPTEEPREPGTLTVIGPESVSGDDQPAAQVSDQVTIEIIFDTSGSMLAAMPDGQRRIDVARSVLVDLVTNQLPPGVPVALRVFGSTPDSCETSLLVPPQPLDPEVMAGTIQSIEPVNLVKTPLGASLEQVASDLASVEGPKIVVLVTDGEETCDGDPARAIQTLVAQGIDVQVNIVGFALDDDALRAQFSEWAQLGNGTYFDATNAAELDEAIAQAVQAPFRVLDADGNEVARGTVGGNPVQLPAGTYTVVVLTDPEQRYEDVVIEDGGSVELRLDAP